MIPLRDFTNSCNSYLKKKHQRVLTARQIGKTLRDEGFQVGNRNYDGSSCVVVLSLKTIQTIETIKNPISSSRSKTSSDLDSFDSYNSFSEKREPLIVKTEKIGSSE